jgi:hypothetical protein
MHAHPPTRTRPRTPAHAHPPTRTRPRAPAHAHPPTRTERWAEVSSARGLPPEGGSGACAWRCAAAAVPLHPRAHTGHRHRGGRTAGLQVVARPTLPVARCSCSKQSGVPTQPAPALRQAHSCRFHLAAAASDPTGMFNLGVCYEQGLGVERDLSLARKWYRLSPIYLPPVGVLRSTPSRISATGARFREPSKLTLWCGVCV